MSPATLAAILCALSFLSAVVAGVFQAFSDFIMRGLGEIEGKAGMQAMQRINVTVLRSLFLASFLVLAISLVLVVWIARSAPESVLWLVWFSAGLYLLGVFLVTLFINVPMNEKLDRLVLHGDYKAARDYWQLYLRRWTLWNHVRSASSAVTAGLLLAAVLKLLA